MSTCVTVWIRVCLGKESPCWLVQEGTGSGDVCGALSPAGDVEAEQRSNVVNGTIPQLEGQRKGQIPGLFLVGSGGGCMG